MKNLNLHSKFLYHIHNWKFILQNLILKVSLFLIYFIGIGLTALLMPFIGRKYLKKFKANKNNRPSYWTDAEGYDQTTEELSRQV